VASDGKDRLSVIIVEDEAPFAELLRAHLAREGCAVRVFHRAEAALEGLRAGELPHVLLVDVQMPGMSGLDLLRTVRADVDAGRMPSMPAALVMSAYGSIERALEAVRLGASDFVSKPFRLDELTLKLRLALERRAPQPSRTSCPASLREGLGRIVGRAPAMQLLYRVIEKVADYKSTVLVTGESGTGKELVARALHERSRRAAEPFVAVNCGAIPANLLESELFGHVKGAFTDANQTRRGLFEEAHRGTLFLDEIGEMPMSLQVKLLRVLQEEEVRRIGDNKAVPVDVRVVAATARDLAEEVKLGRFREDLFYRLNVLPVHIPPLRERSEDIPVLVAHFLEETNRRLGTRVRTVSAEAAQRLASHGWPGNVRELQNVVERAIVLADGDEIGPELVPGEPRVARDQREEVSQPPIDAEGDLSIKRTSRVMEERLIRNALAQTRGNRTHAAKLLEISHRALLYKMKEYGIDVPARGSGDEP